MAARSTGTSVVALLLVVTMAGSAGLAVSEVAPVPRADAATGASVATAATPAAAATPSSPTVDRPAELSAPAVAASSNVAASMAAAALAATKAAGLSNRVVYVPRPSATSAQVSQAQAAGVVSPLYSGTPAPVGLAYYGLEAGPHGSVVGSVLNTTSLVANVDLNQTGVVANDLFQSSPDSFGIQLNAVVTNITLFGHDNYSFWTQNVVTIYPAVGSVFLITNVWNFSGGPLSANVFYQHGPWGTQVATEYYYAEYRTLQLTYPFNLTLYLNSTVTDGRDNVSFNVGIQAPGSSAVAYYPYDWVDFNSIAAHDGTPVVTPSPYTANGFRYNPVGLTDDFELIFGGPGGGSQATLFSADATLGLGYWSPAAHGGRGGYTSVPSAVSYGGETGETVIGASVAWNDSPSATPMPGIATYGTMTTGPTFLTGLWNATTPVGSYPVTLDVTPSNAFTLFAPGPAANTNFTIDEFALAPELNTHVVYLSPGTYTVETELSNYLPVYSVLTVSGPATLSLALTADRALGIYTPLWAFSNAQLAAISTSGSGTPASPYVIVNDQYGLINSQFGLYNDYAFPVYPSVFLFETTASVEFLHPPSFGTATNTFQYPGPELPASNDLQYWFWNVSHVAVVGAGNISGWFGLTTYTPAVSDTFNMIFYNSTDNLVASDTFDTQAGGLLMFIGSQGPPQVGGETIPPPPNPPGNTVWDNTFNFTGSPASEIPLLPNYYDLGLELAESFDTVYDNAFYTPTTAWLLPLDLYTGYSAEFSDRFNITEAPASEVNYAKNFPLVPLTGSIANTSYQGGNFWWDYGSAFNPYNGADDPFGLLPYAERAPTLISEVFGPDAYYDPAYIYPGGDYVPLTRAGPLYPVGLTEGGLPSGVAWGELVVNQTGSYSAYNVTAAGSVRLELPDGSYLVYILESYGWEDEGPTVFPFQVDGKGLEFSIPSKLEAGFHKLTFKEKDLSPATPWTVVLNATDPLEYALNETETSVGTTIVFAIEPGAYTYAIEPVHDYTSSVTTGSIVVGKGNAKVGLKFTPVLYTVTFDETGLSPGASWAVKVGKHTVHSTGASLTFALAAGSYRFTVKAPKGEAANPASGTFTVSGSGEVIDIVFL